MYETYNFLINHIKNNKNINNLPENYKKLLICFMPVIPHFVNECLTDLNLNKNIEWPEFDKSKIEDEEINLVVQINGKKRGIIKVIKNIDEEELMKMIKNDKMIEKYLNNAKIKKTIFVKNRLINILIDE